MTTNNGSSDNSIQYYTYCRIFISSYGLIKFMLLNKFIYIYENSHQKQSSNTKLQCISEIWSGSKDLILVSHQQTTAANTWLHQKSLLKYSHSIIWSSEKWNSFMSLPDNHSGLILVGNNYVSGQLKIGFRKYQMGFGQLAFCK